jgi:hypothetical protein
MSPYSTPGIRTRGAVISPRSAFAEEYAISFGGGGWYTGDGFPTQPNKWEHDVNATALM